MDTLELDYSININCQKHPKQKIKFLQIKEIKKDQNLFYCLMCLDEDECFKQQNFILVDRIEECDKQIIDKWPPLYDNSIHKKIKQCSIENQLISQLPQKIETIFENLKLEIVHKIDQVKKKMINNSMQFSNNSNHILQKYQELSQINFLKQILIDSNLGYEQKENKFKELVLDLESQQQKNCEVFQSLIQNHEINYNLIDFEFPNKIKSSIFHLIDQINIFTLEQNEIDKITFNQKINDSSKNSQLLFDLISTKSNNCSEKFLTSIKHLFNQISPLIERISFEEVFIKGKQQIDFSKLNENQIQLINEYSQHITAFSNEQFNQMNTIKNSNEIKQLMAVLNLKTSYLNKEFLIDFEKYLIDTYPFFKKAKLNRMIKDKQKIKMLSELTEETLNNVIILIQNINVVQKYGNYTPQLAQRIKQFCSTLQTQEQQNEDLDKSNQNQPIFDSLNCHKQIDILPFIQMIKTDYGKSQKALKIEKNLNNQISISLNTNGWANCVSNFVIDQNITYIFRFQFINNSQTSKNVYIGLLRNTQKDLTQGYNDHLSCHFNIGENKFYGCCQGIVQNEKGNFKQLRGDQKEIEMRVCIKEEILEILDYPNYNHILSISDIYKNNLKQYQDLRLYIGLKWQNMSIVLTHAYKQL